MHPVIVENSYDVPAAQLWALVTDYKALVQVMEGIVSFEGLPEGRVETGQKIDVTVSLFGILPNQPYRMEVLECDNANMFFRSSETGAGVKSWHHTARVIETETGCRLIDEIDIDAGWRTPLFRVWARFLYTARHRPRLRLLAGKT